MTNQVDSIDYLTDKRFDKRRSETISALAELRNDENVDQDLIDKIDFEDAQILIKLRSYKSCKIQIVASVGIIVFGISMGNATPLFYFGNFIGFIVLISSWFGLRSNKVSDQQLAYITS